MSENKDYEPQYEYKNNKYYKLFIAEKQEIKDKYPQDMFYEPTMGRDTLQSTKEYMDLGYRELHGQYLRELADLIFKPGGNYQLFTWDIMGEAQKDEMEKKARGRINPRKIEY